MGASAGADVPVEQVGSGVSTPLLSKNPLLGKKSEGGTPELWAIASGKGGVGRSFLTANLGCIMARDVGPVTLLDVDFGGGNLHTFLGVSGATDANAHDGLGAFLRAYHQGRQTSLEALARGLEVPGMKLVSGVGTMQERLSSPVRGQLVKALSTLKSPRVLMDLESGGGEPVLELFSAAQRPLLVVLPEPAAVEDAHSFIRRWYLRSLQVLAAQQGISKTLFLKATQEESLPLRPASLMSRLGTLKPGIEAELTRHMASRTLYLVLNQVRHASDVSVGIALKRAVQSFFGIRVRFVGAVRYDADAWLSTRRRRLRVREGSSDALNHDLMQLIQNVMTEQECEGPD